MNILILPVLCAIFCAKLQRIAESGKIIQRNGAFERIAALFFLLIPKLALVGLIFTYLVFRKGI